MFKRIIDGLESAHLRSKLKGGYLVCPDCGSRPNNLPGKQDQLLTCRLCGTKASIAEWTADEAQVSMLARADNPPIGTKIRESDDGMGGTVWEIPASKKFNFFLFFALFWLGITAAVSGGFIFALIDGAEIEGNFPTWGIIPFLSIFWIIGLVMLNLGLRQMLAKHKITVSGGRLIYRQEMIGLSKVKTLSCHGMKSVERKEFYQQNYTPVYGIEIKGTEGKIRFGSILKDDEKLWLVAAIRQAVFGKPEQSEASAPDAETLGTIKVGGGQLKGLAFSEVVPNQSRTTLLSGLICAAIGLGLLFVGIKLIGGEPLPAREDGKTYIFNLVFWIFDSGFLVIWIIITSIFAIAGIGMALSALRNRGGEQRIEGNSSEISIRTYKRGFIAKDESFPRSDVTDIRASASGSLNGKPMKRVELIIGDKAKNIARWMDGEKADELVKQIRAKL